MRRISLYLTVIAIVALAAVQIVAQTTSTADETTIDLLNERGTTVLPLEDVTESAEQILDITDTSARLNFVGTIPLACTVVFGTTPDFGNASIDQDMGGGAIIEHNPLMLDLAPDTTYYFRVQGSAEDGTFYVSEVGTFRTLPEGAVPNNNLLSPENDARVLDVSSTFGGGPDDGRWGILNAFDDNENTEWATDGDGDDAFFEVELTEETTIRQLVVQSRQMADGTSIIESFTLTNEAGEVFGPFETPDPDEIYVFDVEIVASTLRFDAEQTTGGNVGLAEFVALEQPQN